MSPCPTVMSSATTVNLVVSAAWLIWGMMDNCEEALLAAGVLKGAGVRFGVLDLPVSTQVLVLVLAGVSHHTLVAALSLPVAACLSLSAALMSRSLRVAAILLLCSSRSLWTLAWYTSQSCMTLSL